LARAEERVALGAASILFVNIVQLVLNVGTFIIIANLLPTSEIGIISGIQILVLGVSTLSTLSLHQAVMKFIPEQLSRNEPAKALYTLRLSFFSVLAAATPLSALLFFAADPISKIIFRGEANPLWIQVAAVDSWVFALALLFTGLLMGQHRIPRASLLQIVSFSVRYLLSAVLVILGFSVLGVVIAYLIGDLVLLVFAIASATFRLANKPERVPLRMLYGYSLPLLLAVMIGQLGWGGTAFGILQIDKVFALLQLGPSQLGVYTVVVAAASIAAFAPTATAMALVPTLSSISARGQRDQFLKVSRAYTRYVSLIAVPVSFMIASLAPALTQLFGTQYLPGALPAAAISIAVGVTAIGAVYQGQLLAQRGTREVMIANGIGLAFFISLLFALIPSLGLMGAAWSRAIMTIIIVVLMAFFTRIQKNFVLDWRAYFASIAASTAMALILFSLVTGIGDYQRQIASLPLLIPLGFTLYFFFLRALRTFTNEDVKFLADLLPHRLQMLTRWIAKIGGIEKEETSD